MINLSYTINWPENNSLHVFGSLQDLTPLFQVNGSIDLLINEICISLVSGTILVDLIQIINALSEISISRYEGKILPITFDDETRLTVYYSDYLLISDISNPPKTENISLEEAVDFSSNLAKRALKDIETNAPFIVSLFQDRIKLS